MKTQSPAELNRAKNLMILQMEINKKLTISPYVKDIYVTKADLRSMVHRGFSKLDLEAAIRSRLARVIGWLHGEDAKLDMHLTIEVDLKTNRVMIIAQDWPGEKSYIERRKERDATDARFKEYVAANGTWPARPLPPTPSSPTIS